MKLKNWHTVFSSPFFLFVTFAQFSNSLSLSLTDAEWRWVIVILCFFHILLNEAADWSVLLSHLKICVWLQKAESIWLRERSLALTCYKNMSQRMGDKRVLGSDCQQKWISAREDTTLATIHWFTASWQLFTMTLSPVRFSRTFYNEKLQNSNLERSASVFFLVCVQDKKKSEKELIDTI